MIKAFLLTIGYVFVASAQSFLSINEERFLQVTGNINAPCKLSTTGETCTDKGFCCATVTGFDQDRVTLVPSTTSGTCVPAEFDGVQIRTLLNGWYTPTCSFRATVTNYMSALGS